MLPDMYTLEKLALEHRQQLLREAEHERMLAMADSPKRASHAQQRFTGNRATFLYKTENSLSSAVKHLPIIANLAHRRAIGG
jgi:hypothetical protein